MRSVPLIVVAVAASLGASRGFAGDASCYEQPATRQYLCYDNHHVTVNGPIRAAPFLMGGPNGIHETAFTLVVDCAKKVATIQDREGVNFGGGRSDDNRALRSLVVWMCEEPKPRRNPKLKMF